MVLATVIIAALIGGGALGLAAYEGFAKPIQKIGQGLAGGLSIVFLAIVLDRITQAWGTRPEPRSRHVHSTIVHTPQGGVHDNASVEGPGS